MHLRWCFFLVAGEITEFGVCELLLCWLHYFLTGCTKRVIVDGVLSGFQFDKRSASGLFCLLYFLLMLILSL